MNKNTYFKVLDKGFLGIVDWMGNDEAVVQAARVSYGKGTKKVSDDKQLIRYLVNHEHMTPLEMCEIKLHVKVPMDCWRQWIRTRTASVNEQSTRYSEATMDKQETPPDKWRLQSRDNKQGSCGYLPEIGSIYHDGLEYRKNIDGEYFSKAEKIHHEHADKLYQHRLEHGIAREQARKDLPLSTYTEAYWKIDLRNLFHFLKLRLDPHAQEEIRSYAFVIACITKELFPIAFEAFLDYGLNSVKFSGPELIRLYSTITNNTIMFKGVSERENQEFNNKIQNLRNPRYSLNQFNINLLKNYKPDTLPDPV